MAAERGTPQGPAVSPILASIYVHYVLDLWAHRWRKQHATGGDVIIVRYADDSVMGFQRGTKARPPLRAALSEAPPLLRGAVSCVATLGKSRMR